MLSDAQKNTLQQFFDQERAIVAAYLFGSFAKGTPTPSSDIDLAFLLDKKTAGADSTELSSRYSVDLSEKLGREVDVIILNEAPPFLKFQVLRYGQPLFERDVKRSRRFMAASLIEYFDFEPLKRSMEERIIQRLKERPA